MAKKSLEYISDVELKKAYKRAKILTIVQTVLVCVMLVYAVLMTMDNGINPFTFLPLVFTPMIIAGALQMRHFKKEIIRRTNLL
ncbi:hypothetical protein LPB136_12060 [Tenacibaculum todarodis]|uniref:Redox-active disulfide protein 2 n=1 Tax=Tenacibaculum todarodis TaxID=1850252 RepID=A0A1L3JLP8_9FLAO|nr:hypothetical protein [Tenacibaculum todarodis]APG66057.1 hypothetical protein LPB136_12060 [Tenacibaculum todarodis]